ncbi:MAG: DUF4230 domain-containing protein [Clostridium sp.]|nr:DUF4230 domain-containing protein [Clostridium sp.]
MANEYEDVRSAEEATILERIDTVTKKVKLKTKIRTIALAVALVAIAFTSYKLVTRSGSGMTLQSIRDIAQLATLEFRYRDVIAIIEKEEFKLFGLWDIDPGEHILIVQYDGVIKLGIDCKKILFNEYRAVKGEKKKIEIKLPEVELLSSETPMNSFEILMNKGVYTDDTVDMGVFFKEAAKRQEQHVSDVLNGELGRTARENAKRQLQAILESFSEIRDDYELVWVN